MVFFSDNMIKEKEIETVTENCLVVSSKRNGISAGGLVRRTVGWYEREVTLIMSGRKGKTRGNETSYCKVK